MTSANVMNLGNMDQTQIPEVTSKGKNTVDQSAVAFSKMMVSATATKDMPVDAGVAQTTVSKTEAYDRYQYQDNAVEDAKVTTIQDKVASKMEDATEEIDSAQKDIVEKICDTFEVDEEAVEEAMEVLGLSVLELMDPQKLAQLVMNLEGMTDSTELLMDSKFQNLMSEIAGIGEELFTAMELSPEEKDVFLMQIVEATENLEITEAEDAFDMDMPMVTVTTEGSMTEKGTKAQDKEEALLEPLPEETEEATVQVKVSGTMQKSGADADSDTREEHNPNMAQNVQLQNAPEAPIDNVIEQRLSYSDIDTLDVIQQIAENVRIILDNEETSMSMQLNPENLGKVYLNISSKEGVVNAQIAAQNESVKQALELQLAELRQNLNQAGVKVNSIEITVATHEFERNLEQNANQEQHQSEQESHQERRRNISMDSLDELSGLMTEEEKLVAQMMKDNGNSVDLTA